MSTKNKTKNTVQKIKEFWLKYEPKIVLIMAFILVAILAFEAGVLRGQKWQQSPLVIEKQAISDQNKAQNAQETQNLAPETTQNSSAVSDTASAQTPSKDCQFVGSKNSNKYHIPTCSSAKRIKPENLVCFKDENDAKGKGYGPDRCVGK